jgi:GT2 family glycosyltransferase
MSRVAVIIPNWNGEEYIKDCLDSLQKQTVKPHIIVVENGSNDNSVRIIKQGFPKVELLEFEDNAGFAGGVNRGIKVALKKRFDFIVLFNNDAIADKNWLENLVNAAVKHPEAGIITGKFMRLDKKHIDSTGECYTIWGMPFPRGRNQLDVGQFNSGEYVFGASGGASLYKRVLFESIGLFDEDFFAYYEDVDISFRAQLADWKVWYEPSAVAYHAVGATSSKLGNFSRYHSLKNFNLLWLKNLPWQIAVLCLPLLLLQFIRLNLTALIKNRSVSVIFKSKIKFISLLPSTLKKRREIQKTRKVSMSYIYSIILKSLPPIIKKV